MVTLPKTVFPVLGRSVLGLDRDAWPCLPGGTWSYLRALQAAHRAPARTLSPGV